MEKELSQKQKDYEKRWEMFQIIWKSRPKKSQLSGKPIYGSIKSFYFDHLLERNKYPDVQYCEWNILVVLEEEHTRKSRGFPGKEQPLDRRYKELILKAKQKYEEKRNNQDAKKGS